MQRAEPGTRAQPILATILAGLLGALMLLLLPAPARAVGWPFEQYPSAQVTYRLNGVALIKNASGRTVEQSLMDAPLGAGARIRYLIIATNHGDKPQVAGAAVHIPQYTVWDPSVERQSPDIVEWTMDGKHWHTGKPSAANIQSISVVRWVLADLLAPGMSASYVFQLRLTGPYSDRTGDMNAERTDAPQAVTALLNPEIFSIRQLFPQVTATARPARADPLALGSILSDARDTTIYRGKELATLLQRGGIRYGATGTALVKQPNGVFVPTPLEKAHLKPGDRVRYEFVAENVGDEAHEAGSTFALPSYARLDSVSAHEASTLEVSADRVHWSSPSLSANEDARAVRWTYQGLLQPGETATYSVELSVRGAAQSSGANAVGDFFALSPSEVKSVQFSGELKRVEASNAHHSVDGVPLTTQFVKTLSHVSLPGFVHNDATPVPTSLPLATLNRQHQFNMLAIVSVAAIIVFVVIFFSQSRDVRLKGESGPTGVSTKRDRASEDFQQARSANRRSDDLNAVPNIQEVEQEGRGFRQS